MTAGLTDVVKQLPDSYCTKLDAQQLGTMLIFSYANAVPVYPGPQVRLSLVSLSTLQPCCCELLTITCVVTNQDWTDYTPARLAFVPGGQTLQHTFQKQAHYVKPGFMLHQLARESDADERARWKDVPAPVLGREPAWWV